MTFNHYAFLKHMHAFDVYYRTDTHTLSLDQVVLSYIIHEIIIL